MIKDFLPLSQIRLEILSELIIRPLLAKEISNNIGRSIQSTFNALTSMTGVIEKKQNLYEIKDEIKVLLGDFLLKFFLERRLNKYFYSLNYIKRYLEPEELIFFGSFFRGDFNKDSDIDIYILTRKDSKEVEIIENKLTKILKIKFQIVEVHPDVHLTKKDNLSNLYNIISKDRSKGIKIPLNLI